MILVLKVLCISGDKHNAPDGDTLRVKKTFAQAGCWVCFKASAWSNRSQWWGTQHLIGTLIGGGAVNKGGCLHQR